MTGKRQWMLRLPGVILLIVFLAAYQTKALAWQKQLEDNRAAIAEVERENDEIRAMQTQASQAQEATAGVSHRYTDGSYTASAMGFGGPIEVCVTLSQDQILEIRVLKHDGEDSVYLEEAVKILERILQAQSTDVDTIAGATFSSTGILEAVRAALLQAEV